MSNKPNAFLRRISAQHEADLRFTRQFALQWGLDAAIIAANRVFHRRGDKLVEFATVLNEIIQEIATITVDDAKGDKSIVYTKDKVDKNLREILGDENFTPWDERYTFD